VHQALLELRPHPIVGGPSNSCVTIPPYEAHLIIDQRDMVAIGVATEEMLNCHFNGERSFINAAQALMDSQATLSIWHAQTQALAALQGIKGLVHRMTSLPGQRSIVIVSGGFLTDTLGVELEEIVDRALHAGVTLNALDARGLYAKTPITNGAQGPVAATGNSTVIGQKLQMLLESTQRQTDGMQFLAFDTGGGFFSNSNDLDAGFRQAADLPETYYLLAFSPQNLKLDGALHPILVKLVAARGLSVQARRGYYAPRKSNDPSAQEKEEIQEAVFSPGETHELPIDVQTQFFLKSEADARIAVQTSLDVRRLRLRKEGDRNLDNLTFVTVVFDRDGHVVSGQQRLVELRLRDSSLESLVQTGITIRTLFNVRPGNYLVRAVVRDSESGQISGLNRTVEIPY